MSVESTPLPPGAIAFQGALGSYSHLACHEVFPAREVLPCRVFEDVLGAVASGAATLAMIPIENSLAGRVADIHILLPESGLFIIGEHFLRVRHQLLGVPGATLATLTSAASHPMALGQVRARLRELGLEPIVAADTAVAADEVARAGDPSRGAIASALAAEIYGLEVVGSGMEDANHNTTRFLIMSGQRRDCPADGGVAVTSFVFQVRNVPAALYKALGGVATNGVNMTKLESYQIEGSFTATQFYADVEGHPDQRSLQLAMQELEFFSAKVTVLGTYPGHPYRLQRH